MPVAKDKNGVPKWKHVEPGEPGNTKRYRICGGKNRNEEPLSKGRLICQNKAGYKTDHVGVGRCYLHWGNQRYGENARNYIHGRSATVGNYVFREKFKQQGELNPDALNLYGELEAQRHLLYTAWERYEDPEKRGGLTIDHLRDLVNDVVKTAEKMVNMRNSTALTMVEIGLVQKRIIDGIERFIPNPDTQRAFVEYVTGGLLESDTRKI